MRGTHSMSPTCVPCTIQGPMLGSVLMSFGPSLALRGQLGTRAGCNALESAMCLSATGAFQSGSASPPCPFVLWPIMDIGVLTTRGVQGCWILQPTCPPPTRSRRDSALKDACLSRTCYPLNGNERPCEDADLDPLRYTAGLDW